MKELEYPFDSSFILSNKKVLKKQLLNSDTKFLEKRIAILGGSTTDNIKNILELFLLNYGIKPIFYESEFTKYYADSLFGNEELDNFNPDIIYIHTTNRNINFYPEVSDSVDEVNIKLENEYNRFVNMWNTLSNKFNAIIIQNNFELLFYRLLGNMDIVDYRGKNNFINKLNNKFYEYASNNPNFFINDINYVSSCYGLDKWSNQFYWYMYKYALDLNAIPDLAFNIAKIIKAIYGKNKKSLVFDLDNTLWGGIVGDDGVSELKIGPDLSSGQVFYEFQKYAKDNKDLGVILNVISKNEYENAIAGLNHPEGVLKPDDFIIIKANWEPKSLNITSLASELELGADSFVFVDDNPAERKIVGDYVKNIAVPDIGNPEDYIRVLDKNGYFECIKISNEDMNKSKMYKDNIKRNELISSFSNYEDYLLSLNMKADVKSFKDIYLERIAQLTNKSNQFNLTTKRYSDADIKYVYESDDYIKLYGKLEDIFGDNGVISVVIGNIKEDVLDIDLWIMSCRVLKRNMEYAMMDELVSRCVNKGIKRINGYYYPTAKNKMVLDFYEGLGFTLDNIDSDGNKFYHLDVDNYKKLNNIIEVYNED